jgi:hypothetical protein
MKLSDVSACGFSGSTSWWHKPKAAGTAASPVFRLALLAALSALVGLDAAAPAYAGERNTIQATPSRMPANSPLCFEATRGQVEGDVRFVARGPQCDVLITPTEAVLILEKRETSSPASPFEDLSSRAGKIRETLSVRFRLENANPQATVSGLEELPAKANYFIGNDPAQWRTGVPLYSQVRIDRLYPGVHLVYYADESARLEYDFVLDPNATLDPILIRIEGVDSVDVDMAGNLRLRAGGQEIQEHAPAIYQVVNGTRKRIQGGYRLKGKALAGFWVGEYDHTRPLVIDPTLTFSTFLGGFSTDKGWGIAVDGSGNVWVAGETLSPNLPTTTNAFRRKYQGGNFVFGDAFVAEFANGTNLSYLTYLGGSGEDAAFAIAVDANGAAFVTGYTDSENFPISTNAYQRHLRGINLNPQGVYPVDAFVTKLNANGTIAYSTYLGGEGRDVGLGIAVDNQSRAYVTGLTESSNFPTVNALRGHYRNVLIPYPIKVNGQITYAVTNNLENYDGSVFQGLDDAFVTRINADGTGLEYSTFLGGGGWDIGQGIAVDTNGCAYVVGVTSSGSFPVVTNNALAKNLHNSTNGVLVSDAFISKLSPDGSNLVYSTYLGSNGRDIAMAVAVDSLTNAYVTGFTYSPGFPVTATNFTRWTNPTNLNADVFVTRFNSDGGTNYIDTNNFGYSVVFGGPANDEGLGIAVDANQNAYIVGFTGSRTRFADLTNTISVPPGFSSTNNSVAAFGTRDVFIVQLAPEGTAIFRAYLGGSGNDLANGIALGMATITNADSTLSTNVVAYIVGTTASPNFPVTGTSKFHGNRLYPDAFVARIDFTNSAVGP